MHIRESITINAAPNVVFPYITDPENGVQWDSSLESMEMLTETPFGKGSRVREVRKTPMGRNISIEEVTEFEKDRLMAWATVEGKMLTRGSIKLDRRGSTTELTMDMQGSLPLLQKPLAPLINMMVGREIRSNLSTLKKLAEGEFEGTAAAATS
jgi:uncharacterized membrane protein